MTCVEAQGGHDTDLFGDFVEGDPALGKELQKAVRGLMTSNDLSGFNQLATRLTQSLDKVDPQAVGAVLDASGIKHRKGQSGEIVMDLRGSDRSAMGRPSSKALLWYPGPEPE